MKAKRLRDGKIVEVEKHGDAMIDEDGKVLYFDEICEVDEPDWQQVRIQAAIAAMQVFIEHPNGASSQMIAKDAVRYADALVAELKRSDDVYAECRRMDAVNTSSVCENMTKLQKEFQKKGEQNER